MPASKRWSRCSPPTSTRSELIPWLVTAVWFASASAQPEEPDDGLTWYVMPTAAFDTDEGLGAGARAEFAWMEVGYAPYRTALVLDTYFTTSGYQQHRLRLDQLGIGRRGWGRLQLRLAWRQWLNDGYWGIGGGTVREREFVGRFASGDPARRRYTYRLYQPYLHAVWIQRLQDTRGWQAVVWASPRFSRVETYEGSVLEAQQPYGMAGGPGLQLGVGLQHDTRQPERVPERGHLFEVSGRVAPQLAGEAGGFAGPMVNLRAYASPVERVVVAGRVMGEWLFGTVPFYEMVHWGGATPVSGMGGFETVRGLTFGRIRAPGKAVGNLEARVRVATLDLGRRRLGLELTPFVDAGAVWDAPRHVAGTWLYPAGGVGGRLILDETFVGRLDTGWGYDPILEADGTVSGAATFGLYLVFDYAY